MRVSLHRYVTDPSLPQRDGVNLAHENITALMESADPKDFDVEFHDFLKLMDDMDYARDRLGEADCVIANVGPHAHYYFYLREKLGLDFRIIRDVRTALWSPYLLQEHLIAPLLRHGDVLLTNSEYSRTITLKLFPHLHEHQIEVCYPLTVGFPEPRPVHRRTPRSDRPTILGFISRLSDDKNFPQLIDLLISLNLEEPGKYQLLACGDVHSDSCHPETVKARLVQELGNSDCFIYMPARPILEIWDLYAQMDVLIFPSTSNLETLGRIVIEASYAGLPILGSRHAAAAELLPESMLFDVNYQNRADISAHRDHALGTINPDQLKSLVQKGVFEPSTSYEMFRPYSGRFFKIIQVGDSPAIKLGNGGLSSEVPGGLLESIEARMPSLPDREQSLQQLENLREWFLDLHKKESEPRDQRLDELLEMSEDKPRTTRFIEKTAHTCCDFTDVGGIDLELCHVVRFYPKFSMTPPASESHFSSSDRESLFKHS